MKARKFYFFILSLLVGVLTFDYFLNQKLIQLKPKSSVVQVEVNHESNLVKAITQKNERIEPAAEVEIASGVPVATDSMLQFRDEFNETIALLQANQVNSESTQNVLQAMARQLEPDHQIFLKNILYNPKSRTEEISLSIELLSRQQTVQSAEILKNFASSQFKKQTALGTDQEIFFRAQAIEGLASFQERNSALSYLNEIDQKTNIQFLKESVGRAKLSIKNEDLTTGLENPKTEIK